MNAKYLPRTAKAICKQMHFTPKTFETLNNEKSWTAFDMENDDDYVVFVVKNARRELAITAAALCAAHDYLS